MKHRCKTAALMAGTILLSAGMATAQDKPATGDASFGKAVYEDSCAACHGTNLGGYIAPGLNKERYDGLEAADLYDLIADGMEDTLMPPWKGKLSDEAILAVADYIINTDAFDIEWNMDDMRKSLRVHVADESALPSKPTYNIKNVNDLIAVTARGTYAKDGSKVFFFDGDNNNLISEIPVERAPHIVNYNPAHERWAYIKTDGGIVHKVDLYSMQIVRSIQVGFQGPSMAVSYDGNYVFTGSFVPNTAVALDAQTLEPVKFFKLEGVDPDGNFVEGDSGSILATHYGPYVSVSLEQTGQVWIVDTSTPDLEVTKIKNVGRHLHDSFLSEDGRRMFIAAYDDNILAAIDFETKEVLERIPAGCQPHTGSGTVFKTKTGRELGVGTNIADCDDTVVTVFDTKTLEVVKQVPVSGATESPASHPDSPFVLVDIVKGDDVDKLAMIDKETLEVTGLIEVGGHAYFPEFTANGRFIYASAGYNGDMLRIYDAKTLDLVKEVPMESPAGIFSHSRPETGTVGLEERIVSQMKK